MSRVVYTLNAWTLNSAGLITCKTSNLDRETKSQYVVVVKAQDMRGLPSGSTATTSVTITVTDVNDNFASFAKCKEEAYNILINWKWDACPA